MSDIENAKAVVAFLNTLDNDAAFSFYEDDSTIKSYQPCSDEFLDEILPKILVDGERAENLISQRKSTVNIPLDKISLKKIAQVNAEIITNLQNQVHAFQSGDSNAKSKEQGL